MLNYRIKGSPPWTPRNTETQLQAEEPQLTQSEPRVPLSCLVPGLQLKVYQPLGLRVTPWWVNRRGSPCHLTRSRVLLPTEWCNSPRGARKKCLEIVQDLSWDIYGKNQKQGKGSIKAPCRWKAWVRRVKREEKRPATCKQHLPDHDMHLSTNASWL